MPSTSSVYRFFAAGLLVALCGQAAVAQQSGGEPGKSGSSWQPLSITQAPPADKADSMKKGAGAPVEPSKNDLVYKENSDFFNVREANANVKRCEWEYEQSFAWGTYRSREHRDDDFWITESLKYGITDDLFVELEVLPINLGDGNRLPNGGQPGNGELSFLAFWQFLHETSPGLVCPPAAAVWAEMRIPSGCGSEKVDATFHLTLTKTICPGWRAHLDGFIETANGSRGDEDRSEGRDWWWWSCKRGDDGGRRHFQWGIGPAVDYEINKCNLLVFNYLNKSSDEEGNRNNNIFEAGWVYKMSEHQVIKVAVDAEVHPEAEGAHWLMKAQYGISW